MSATIPPLSRIVSTTVDGSTDDVVRLVSGTRWEDDARVQALKEAEHALAKAQMYAGDMLWEMHLAAEEAEGVMCADCRAVEEDAKRYP